MPCSESNTWQRCRVEERRNAQFLTSAPDNLSKEVKGETQIKKKKIKAKIWSAQRKKSPYIPTFEQGRKSQAGFVSLQNG